MERGPNISPVTLRPRTHRVGNEVTERQQQREKALRERVEDLGIGESDAGQRLRELVARKMQARINKLIAEDPEAMAYKKILESMGQTEDMARRAVAELEQMSRRA